MNLEDEYIGQQEDRFTKRKKNLYKTRFMAPTLIAEITKEMIIANCVFWLKRKPREEKRRS